MEVLSIDLLIRIGASIGLGFLLGLERELTNKYAGLRTHILVCLGACIFTLISIYGFPTFAESDNVIVDNSTGIRDTSRVAAQIVTGIGFIGAGMIVYRQHEVRGLTTAAGVWTTAGIGMACGSGELYWFAIGATVLMIAVQCLLHMPFRIFSTKRTYSVKIEFVQTVDENLQIKELFGTDRFNKLVITREEGQTIYSATLNTEKEYSSTRLNEIMQEHSFIRWLERCDNE
jgi:putative Mg2+ transporter-C (MgtC) family protein